MSTHNIGFNGEFTLMENWQKLTIMSISSNVFLSVRLYYVTLRSSSLFYRDII